MNSVSPIREVDHENRLIGAEFALGCMPIDERTMPLNREYLKCKFIVLKYVWDNWANEKLVDGKKDALREPFSDNLEDAFEDLGK